MSIATDARCHVGPATYRTASCVPNIDPHMLSSLCITPVCSRLGMLPWFLAHAHTHTQALTRCSRWSSTHPPQQPCTPPSQTQAPFLSPTSPMTRCGCSWCARVWPCAWRCWSCTQSPTPCTAPPQPVRGSGQGPRPGLLPHLLVQARVMWCHESERWWGVRSLPLRGTG